MNTLNNYFKSTLKDYPFAVKWDISVVNCNPINDLSNKVCVPNKTEDLNIHVFNMITGKNQSNIITKDDHVNVNVNLMKESVPYSY